MECYNCGCRLSEMDYCTGCGADVRSYKKIMYAAEYAYNDGLARASVRDLSGAINSLRQCLRYNKGHVDARNLLGLIYFECGEHGAALIEWVTSTVIREDRNIARDYIEIIQSNQGRLDNIKMTIKKYNVSLDLCKKGDLDMAVIQLRKVLNLNPKFVKAHQLLGLLYIQREEWDKAKRELLQCKRIDNGDINTLRYLKEVENRLNPDSGRNGNKKKNKNSENAVYKPSGNDVIIQPLNVKEPLGVNAFVQLGLGIIIGLCVAFFVILPAKVQNTRDEMNEQILEYVNQLDQKNVEISVLQNRVTQLEQTNLALQEDVDGFTGNNGAMGANNALLAAAYAELDSSQSAINVEEYLSLISEDYIEQSASTEFLQLYNYLKGQIGVSVSSTYYSSGIDAYNQQDYPTAIAHLEKAYQYDNTNENALYYLAVAYMESGDVTHAKELFYDLINYFPQSPLVAKAEQKLQEIEE